LRLAAAAFAL